MREVNTNDFLSQSNLKAINQNVSFKIYKLCDGYSHIQGKDAPNSSYNHHFFPYGRQIYKTVKRDKFYNVHKCSFAVGVNAVS